MSAVLEYLPRGNTLSDEEWHRRHRFLQWILAGHVPALAAFALLRGFAVADVAEALTLPLACLIVGHLLRSRRLAAAFITLGLVYCSAALVGFSDGAIEAHFHFFIMIGFIALYQDWVPFLLNIGFTVLSHGIGSSLVPDLMFNHASAQQHPWAWSLIHGVAVLAACVGVVLFWKSTEDEQGRSLALTKELADAEIGRRRFTSDLLVNLARRNQNLLYRQLDLLNELEDKERDPDALANLFRLDHLATRIRRNAESLLVLSGEDSPRTWREPVQLVDVIRAAIAEIEDLDRVDDAIDETLAVSGRTVADLTHLFAELLENAVHFSPPGVTVVVRSRPVPSSPGIHLVTIEDWGVGMTPQELAEANDLLRTPREVDLSVSQRLGLHVVARLAHRYGITVELTPTPGGGVTAVAVLPPVVFERSPELVGAGSPALNGYGSAGRPAAVGVITPPAGTPALRAGFGGPAMGAVNGVAARGGPVAGATRAAVGGSGPAGLVGPGNGSGGPLVPGSGGSLPGSGGSLPGSGGSLPGSGGSLPGSGGSLPGSGGSLPGSGGALPGSGGSLPGSGGSPASGNGSAAPVAPGVAPAGPLAPGNGPGDGAVGGPAGPRPGALGSPVDGRPGALGSPVDGRTGGPGGPIDGRPGTLGSPVAGRTGGPGGPIDGRPGVLGSPVDARPGGATRAGDISSGVATPDALTADAGARPSAPVRPTPPAADVPGRPTPPLPADASARPTPAGDRPGFSLPRRGPGESLARTPLGRPAAGNGHGPASPGPARDDRPSGATPATPATPADRGTGAGDRGPSPTAFGRTPAGGDGAVQPGYSGPRPFGELTDESENWSSWWTRATPVEAGEPGPTQPEPDPQPNGSTRPDPLPLPEPRPPADDSPQLRRRVPQANLAAGLRRETEQGPPAEDNAVVRDPMAARNALSRFQAAQRAARDQVEGDHPEGPSR